MAWLVWGTLEQKVRQKRVLMITKEFSDACTRTKLKMNKGGRDDAYNNNFEENSK